MQNINDERTNRILGATNRVLLGEGVIRDKIHELEFEISPLSFFQNNPTQTDVLYSSALDYAELTGNETVFDIYCGIGTISLFLAGKAAKVVGIESVESAISDARRNAALNGIEHTEFHVGKAEQLMPELHAQGVTADVVVMDPPRKGCGQGGAADPGRHGAPPSGLCLLQPADPGPRPRLAGQARLRAGRSAAGRYVPALHACGSGCPPEPACQGISRPRLLPIKKRRQLASFFYLCNRRMGD